jgi:hypothetical protein
MTASRFAICAVAAVLVAATPAGACVLAPPGSPEAVAERTRAYQAQLWERADAVFLSRVGQIESIRLSGYGSSGRRAVLTPSLVLKGQTPPRPVPIRHTTGTTCGPIPFLDALDGREGDWFVTYARALPSGLSVDATVRIDDLVEPEALRAWSKGYEPSAP